MKLLVSIAVSFALLSAVFADVYLHHPRGSNNRLSEQNRNRDNANRLFDSQNNNQGGYNAAQVVFYEGSEVTVTWTNQHGCGDASWSNCELVMQYMCEDTINGGSLRDGTATTTISTANPNDLSSGRHETKLMYDRCATRQRNKGLFLADQEANLNGDEAIYTRQNTNGARHGYECPEERDYYPYWHPTSWRDIAVITTNATNCPMYQAESQNVRTKSYCNGTKEPDPNNANKILSGSYYNNQADCQADGFAWLEEPAWGIAAPDCVDASINHWSRINHLGNGRQLNANSYTWVTPQLGGEMLCVFRIRYNISTNDYPAWGTFSESNGAASPVKDNPTYDILTGTTTANGVRLKLSMNTDQFGRTFEDRTHVYRSMAAPVKAGSRIVNLNVIGSRGNIVENYPCVEYDYVPANLYVTTSDYIHRQIAGSSTSPAGAGEGAQNTDRSNFVQTYNSSGNYPMMGLENVTIIPNADNDWKTVRSYALQGQGSVKLNNAAAYQNVGVMRYESQGTVYYMSTRNNNFSNRSHKGVIVIGPPNGKKTIFTPLVIAGIVAGGVILIAAVAGVAFLGATGRLNFKRNSAGKATSSVPTGYQ